MTFHLPVAVPAVGPLDPKVDFVRGDVAALAAHMLRCSHARGRLFKVRRSLQTLHSMAAGRIVTLASFAVLLGVALSSVA